MKAIIVVAAMCVIATAGAVAMGESMETDVIAAVVTPGQSTSVYLNRVGVFRLIDAGRRLAVDFPPPATHVLDIMLRQRDREALILVQDFRRSDYLRRGLYRFDLERRELLPLVTTTEADFLATATNIEFYYAPSLSPDGRKLAFHNPDSSSIYVTDLETNETHRVVEAFERDMRTEPRSFWSPDGAQLAIPQAGDTVVVVNADGSNRRVFGNTGDRFDAPLWSQDSDEILLSWFASQPQSIRIIDADDGTLKPVMEGREGITPRWSMCDSRWLSYIVKRGMRYEGRLLHLNTGEVRNLNDHPLLAGVSVGAISHIGCHAMVITERPQMGSGMFRAQPVSIYLANDDGTDVRLISGAGRVIRSDSGWLMYKDVLQGESVIYRMAPTLEAEPEQVATYDVPNVFVRWSDDGSRGFFLSDADTRDRRARLAVIDVESGTVEYLTGPEEYVRDFALWR